MKRRSFLRYFSLTPVLVPAMGNSIAKPAWGALREDRSSAITTLFVAGDVMTGRGIDQILPHPGDPRIFEPYSRSALDYVRLAERTSGPIPRQVDYPYIWGDALTILDEAAPELRIINLETAVTRRGTPWPGKGIQYRMHPDNTPCLTAAGIDCCVLANNHVLDWGYTGFEDTLATLRQAKLTTAGAGADRSSVQIPAITSPAGRRGRILIFACGLPSSGIPGAWAATASRPGLCLLPDLSDETIDDVAAHIHAHKEHDDLVVISLHWGGNWGYPIPEAHQRFAHALIDRAGVDLIHGHSSHHPLGIEVYRGKPVVYGCGDLINDYEGISGHEEYRVDLALLYLITYDRSRRELLRLDLFPMQRQKFRLNHAAREDRIWLQSTLDRVSQVLGSRVTQTGEGVLRLQWG